MNDVLLGLGAVLAALLVAAVIEYRRGLRRDAKLMLAIGAGTSAVGLSLLWS